MDSAKDRGKWRSRIKRLGLAALGLAGLLLVLECLTRAADYVSYGAPLLQNYNEESLFTYDALGKRGRPFARYQDWHLNSLGYRGPELKPDKINVACIGASETFGLFEGPDEEYPRQLERDLNQAAGRDLYQVVNVAYPGIMLNSVRIRLPEIMQSIHPQFAVIYPTPDFYIWLPWASGKPPASSAPRIPPAAPFEWRIQERFLAEAKQYIPRFAQTWIRKIQIRRSMRKYGKAMDRIPERNVEQFKSDLRDLIVDLRTDGVQPVLVTHANRFGTKFNPKDRPMLTAWRSLFPMLSEEGFIDMEERINTGLREVAADQRVPLIDAEAQMPSGKEYFADHQHFTTRGAEVMAQILSAGLQPILQASAQSNPRLASPATTSYTGMAARQSSAHEGVN